MMSSPNLKKLAIFLGLVCLALVVVVSAQDDSSASTTPNSSVLELPTSEPAAGAESTEQPDEEEGDDDDDDEEDDEEEEESEDEFLISLEDALAQFVLRHRDVRRDCQDLEIDMQIAQQADEKTADTGLQQEYMACKNYQQELEHNIMELASQISQPSPPPASPPSEPSSDGLLSSITKRLPSIG